MHSFTVYTENQKEANASIGLYIVLAEMRVTIDNTHILNVPSKVLGKWPSLGVFVLLTKKK